MCRCVMNLSGGFARRVTKTCLLFSTTRTRLQCISELSDSLLILVPAGLLHISQTQTSLKTNQDARLESRLCGTNFFRAESVNQKLLGSELKPIKLTFLSAKIEVF